MNNSWRLRLEQVAVGLGLLIIALAALGFLSAHKLADAYEPRFLFSGLMLGFTALYTRFALTQIASLHRVIYRAATSLTIWSLSLFLFPYPGLILYLIPLPAFFYLFRLEVKTREPRQEDATAACLLLVLGVFLYIQQQPLNAILFTAESFNWNAYYTNAPVMILVGLGFIRLHRYTVWRGLFLLGVLVLSVGIVMSGVLLLGQTLPVKTEFMLGVVWCHLIMALLFIPNRLVRRIYDFSAISTIDEARSRSALYGLANLFAYGALVYVLLNGLVDPWWIPFAVLCVALPLHAYRPTSISVSLLSFSLLAFPLGARGLDVFPADVFTGALLAAMLCMVYLRRNHTHTLGPPNITFLAAAFLYLTHVVWLGLFSPVGLLRLVLLFICWVSLPKRPLVLPTRYHVVAWPIICAVLILCLGGGYSHKLLPIWSASILLAPLLTVVFLKIEAIQQLCRRRGWALFLAWSRSSEFAYVFLTFTAAVVGMTAFIFNQSLLASSWLFVGLLMLVAISSAIIHAIFTVKNNAPLWALGAEVFVWLALALPRWKVEVTDLLNLGSPIDGYIVLAAASVVAGIREVVRVKRDTRLEKYFYRSTLIYGVLGWAYLMYLSLKNDLAFHGEIASLVVAGLYFWLAKRRNKGNLLPGFVYVNVGLSLFFFNWDLTNPMFYLLPALSSVLILAHLFKDKLTKRQLNQIRFFTALVMVAVTAWFNVIDFNDSVWYPVTAALVAVLGVVAGVALRIRIYLFLGVTFLLVNVAAAMVHVIRGQTEARETLLIGVVFFVLGLLFTGSFLLFQMKRQEILDRYYALRETLNQWD